MSNAVYLPEALADIDGSYADYEARAAGLSERYLDALKRSVRLIEGNPWLYGEVAEGIRAGLLRHFPHVVYYRPEASRSVILAVRHGRDDPAIWQGRF